MQKTPILSLLCLLLACDVSLARKPKDITLAQRESVTRTLDDYVKGEDKKLIHLKHCLDIYRKEHALASKNWTEYIENPLKAFTLIKLLTTDYKKIDYFLNGQEEYRVKLETFLGTLTGPTGKDAARAAKTLVNYQKAKRLLIKDLAAGKYSGNKRRIPLSTSDCFAIGRALYIGTDYQNGKAWLLEAFRKYNLEKNPMYTFTKMDIMDYIARCYYSMYEITTAILWLEKMVEIDSGDHLTRSLIEQYTEECINSGRCKGPETLSRRKKKYSSSKMGMTCEGKDECANGGLLSKSKECFSTEPCPT